jgi:RNA polymerase sigma factor for flagellar operon FliA
VSELEQAGGSRRARGDRAAMGTRAGGGRRDPAQRQERRHASLEDGTVAALSEMLATRTAAIRKARPSGKEMKSLLIAAIAALPEQDKTVITLYTAKELLLREIAEVLEVTESRVSQIHTRALYRLNRLLATRAGSSA